MAIKLAFNVATYFQGNDINFGHDNSRRFEWTSNGGWTNLVNRSNDLTDEQKRDLFAQMNEI